MYACTYCLQLHVLLGLIFPELDMNRIGFESCWGKVSVAVLMVYLAGLPWEIEHTHCNLLLARHAANEDGDRVKIGKWFRLDHKPTGLASVERVIV